MSLTTRCPLCSTTFKLVPDLLKVSDGWVRCGQCDKPFDAKANLLDLYALSQPTKDPNDATKSKSEPSETVGGLLVAPSADLPPTELASLQGEGLARLSEPAKPSAPLADAPALGDAVQARFMRGAKFHAFWQQAWVKLVLIALVIALSVSMVIQVLVSERDRIVANHPEFESAFYAACEVLGCQLHPWRYRPGVTIESSTFQRLDGNIYRIGFSLRNSSKNQLPWPQLELALTDAQDQVIVRRVLAPIDFDAPETPIQPDQLWSNVFTFRLALSADDPAVAGYRLMVFYP